MTLTKDEVREIRNRLGLSQRALSEKLGLSYEAVRDWEREKRPCGGPAALLLRLIDKLHGTAAMGTVEGLWG